MFEEILDLLLPIIAIIAGIIGLAYGINKFLKKKDSESNTLKYLALVTSIVIGLVNLWAIFEWTLDDILFPDSPEVTMVHWLTVLLIFLAGSSMLAEPLKNTPIAAIIAVIAFGALAGIFLFFADFNEGLTNIELGAINIPLWLVILLIVIIIGILFVVTWFTEFTIDRILQLISWAPVVIIFCGLLTIQGLLMFLLSDAGGIWALI
ncbi:MAG: hypothetical protein ACW991_08730 [Candidatus Hodarchaeales archaeon]|jgi:hypothetical protein